MTYKSIFTIILLSISFVGLSFAQTDKLAQEEVNIQAPFEIPTFKIPNFEHCKNYDIRDFGARQGDKESTTAAIAKAIALATTSGGNIIIPPGEWLTKAIHLKSNVNLHVSAGATLFFSGDPKDYLPAVHSSWEGLECYNYSPLIYAYEATNVAITGKGTIKADLTVWEKWFPRPKPHMESIKNLYNWAQEGMPVEQRIMVNDTSNLRPQFIQFNRCQHVRVEDIKIRNSPFWTLHLYLTKDALIRSIDIYAHGHNNDGIDPEMSQNVLIENCVFDQGDDAIALKSGRNPEGWRLKTPTKNIVIRNCEIRDGHQLLAVGSELSGGIENIYVNNCTVLPNEKLMHLLFIKTNERMGGYVKNIYFSNIKAQNVKEGILGIDTDVLYQWRNLVPTKVKKLTPITNVYLSHIKAEVGQFVSKINGNPELPIQTVQLKDVHLKKTTSTAIQNKYVNDFSYTNSDKSE